MNSIPSSVLRSVSLKCDVKLIHFYIYEIYKMSYKLMMFNSKVVTLKNECILCVIQEPWSIIPQKSTAGLLM